MMTAPVTNGSWSTVMRYMKAYPEYVLGTGNDVFAKKLGESFWGAKDANNGLYLRKLGTQFKDAFVATAEFNEKNIADNGGFWKNLKKSFTSIPDDFKALWKEGGDAAAAASKTGGSKFWMQLKNCSKGVMKRMPLIGTAMMLLTEIPNIARATGNDGLLSGGWETAKAAGRIGVSTLFGAIGTALCPVCPIAGAIVGYAVGDFVSRFIFGKTYTQKQEAEKAAQVQDAVNKAPAQPSEQSNTPNASGYASGQIGLPNNIDYAMFAQNNMSQADLQKLEQQYYTMAKGGNSGLNAYG